MLSLIVAASENNVIGRNNDLPWDLLFDRNRFRELTRGRTVIMGRNTYESIVRRLGAPLPNRRNVILTRRRNFTAPGCEVFHSWKELESALDLHGAEEVFVIGGSQIYAEALPKAERVYKTTVHAAIDGDAFFPKLDECEWRAVSSERRAKDDKNEFDATYTTYERGRIL